MTKKPSALPFIVINSAMVASALNAVADIHKTGATVDLENFRVGEKFSGEIGFALGRAQSQAEIRARLATISETLTLDGLSLSARYADLAWDDDSSHASPSGADLPNLVFQCYNNCHKACHGSRSWR